MVECWKDGMMARWGLIRRAGSSASTIFSTGETHFIVTGLTANSKPTANSQEPRTKARLRSSRGIKVLLVNASRSRLRLEGQNCVLFAFLLSEDALVEAICRLSLQLQKLYLR